MWDLQLPMTCLTTSLLALTFSFMMISCQEQTSTRATSTDTFNSSDLGGLIEAGEMLTTGDMNTFSGEETHPIIHGSDPDNCDPLSPIYCALPWPSDHFIKEEGEKRRLVFQSDTIPTSTNASPHDPSAYLRLDGFGLLATGIAYFESLNIAQLPSEQEIEDSLNPEAKVTLIELHDDGTARRIPCWAEVDGRSSAEGPRPLFLRPAQLLQPDTQYIYALSNLENVEGNLISPSPAFASLRDGMGIHPEGDLLISEDRRSHFEKVFQALEMVGVPRDHLTLAWSFRTATLPSLTGDILRMRDHGLEQMGEQGPPMRLDTLKRYRHPDDEDETHAEWPVHRYIGAELSGVLTLPHYLTENLLLPNGYRLALDASGQVEQRGSIEAPFWMRIPHVALEGNPVGVVLYGHGQLNSGDEVRMADKGPVAQDGSMIFIGTDLWGMSEEELPLIPIILGQLDAFTAVGDRLLQGIFNTLALGRAAKLGFPQLTEALGELNIAIDTSRVVYGGISQGGIFGATILALSQDITRGHLGVPGLHYLTLIGRSRNFSAMFSFLTTYYPDPVERWIALSAAQLIWNKSDPATYYRSLSMTTFPNTPSHQVLLAPAQGDPQVVQLTIEHLARSDLGIPILPPYGDDLPPLCEASTYPHQGSAIVGWHYAPRVPIGAQPAPSDHPDPHETPRNDPLHNAQMIHFWNTGEVIDVCGGMRCGDQRSDP